MLERLTLRAIDLRAFDAIERDRVAGDVGDAAALLASVQGAVDEAFALVTCHRVELYTLASRGGTTPAAAITWNRASHRVSGLDVAEHLMAVAAGLESELVGEPEILGQIAHARAIARERGALGPVLDALATEAIRAGRAARATTGIARGPASIGAAALAVTRQHVAGPIDHALVVGAGHTGTLIAAGLRRLGVPRIDIANRSLDRAVAVARAPGRALGLDDLSAAVALATVVITATSAPSWVLDRDLVARSMARRGARPLLIVDLAVPRDTDPDIGALPGVTLIDLDAVHALAAETSRERMIDAPAVRAIVADHVAAFATRTRVLAAASTIAALHTAAETRRAAIARRASRNLSPEGRAAVDRATRQVAASLLHLPSVALRGGSGHDLGTGPMLNPRERAIRIGTRRSALARAQTDIVVELIRRARPGLTVTIVPLSSVGDRQSEAPIREIGGVGAFVTEIENALRDGRVDIAVHSLKDVPAGERPGLVFAAFPRRGDPRDALALRPDARDLGGPAPWPELPRGAIVGTGSPRRASHLRAIRPDLRLVEIRGNVDTRLTKLDRGDVDGLILAMAGLERLGRLDRVTYPIDAERLVPMVGQGALGIQCRADDWTVREILGRIDDGSTRRCVEAERAFLLAMGAGCELGVGAYARINRESMHVRAFAADGDRRATIVVDGAADDGFRLGVTAAARVIAALATPCGCFATNVEVTP
ncbi:MAG: hydroxymethylbilane synthase [Chloroflexota bacterium]|nr:MAG: hydroxymethylbilane synthase [Chloroflexota bacterium]